MTTETTYDMTDRMLYIRYGLTRRECEIAGDLVHGMSNDEIAASRYVSSRTVKFHVTNINRKFGTRNRTEIALVVLGAIPAPIAREAVAS